MVESATRRAVRQVSNLTRPSSHSSSLQLISEAADSVQTEVEPSTTVDSVGHSEADLKTVQDLKDTLAKVTAVPSTVAITPSDGQHLTLPARIGADLTTIAQLEADMTFEHAGNTSQCLLIGREATLPVPFAEVTIGCDGTNSIDLTPYVDGEMVGPKQAVLYVDKKLRETCADDPAVARNGFWRAYNVGNHPFMVNDSVVGPGQRIRVPPGSTIVFGDTPFVFAY